MKDMKEEKMDNQKLINSELAKVSEYVAGILGLAYAQREIAVRLFGWDSPEVAEAERMISLCWSGVRSALDE